MRTKTWKCVRLKNQKLRIIRENLRTILKLAVESEISRLDHLEDLYIQQRIRNKQVPPHRRRELSIYDKKEKIMFKKNISILEKQNY